MTDVLPFSFEFFAEWKAMGFFLATFILEDLAAVGAGLLLATGGISWPVAFASCFLGIWMGDAGLYGLARFAGREWFERSAFRRFAPKVAVSERWFAERGTAILVFSRLVPGARLPIYLAAGFLRVPFSRFALITGTASFIWTFFILFLVQRFGEQLIQWLNAFKHGGLILLGAGMVVFAMLQLLRRLCLNFSPRLAATWFGRWRRWEFWPAWMFYPPVAIYCLWLAIKYRGLTLPTAANPGIFAGGMVGESKMSTLRELYATSPNFTAYAELIKEGSVEERLAHIERFAKGEPIMLKPDLGQRGVGIKLIKTMTQADAYLSQTAAPLVAQRYAAGPREVGIFYFRFPHETLGHIFAITEKIFPVVTGDGRSTLRELIERDPRACFVADTYLKRFASRRDEVLEAGVELKLVEAGNHAQGCIFRDGMRLNTPELTARIDEISKKLNGFYVGRYDIRFSSEDDLRDGRNFQIIELNGAASEATSIYDARNSLWAAYRTLFRQWDVVFGIGAANRRRGATTTKISQVWQAWRHYLSLAATYPSAD